MKILIVLLIGLVVVLVGGWLLTMPKRDVRGIRQTRGHGMVLNITPFVIEQYEVSQVGAVRALRAPASTWLLQKLADAAFRRDGELLMIRVVPK